MRNTLEPECRGVAGRAALPVLAFTMLFSAGCQEFVHFGQISDRESAFSIHEVKIEQQQPDGTWKQLGKTDGNGKWWILKDRVKGGGRVRISKQGYYPIVMGDAEFLQQNNLVMIPVGEASMNESVNPYGTDDMSSPQRNR